MHIQLLTPKFDVARAVEQLTAHPEAWNEHPWRTEHPRSPHREADDIWLRYRTLEDFDGDMQKFNGPHEAVWYPVADKLPAVKALAFEVMDQVQGQQLGGVLITKIPAGKQVYPHVDHGWHALHYEKFAVQLAGNTEQSFCFDGETLSPRTGELFWFNNQAPHWVFNPSREDRMTLIVCIRRMH
jgi:quercetin dioxygenase-like cupin family protein